MVVVAPAERERRVGQVRLLADQLLSVWTGLVRRWSRGSVGRIAPSFGSSPPALKRY